jgi:hypothetical protein
VPNPTKVRINRQNKMVKNVAASWLHFRPNLYLYKNFGCILVLSVYEKGGVFFNKVIDGKTTVSLKPAYDYSNFTW